MIPSHQRWLRDEVMFDLGDATAAKDEYGLIPEGDWNQVYETEAAIRVLGSSSDEDQRETQSTRWTLVINPPKHTTLEHDTRVSFRGINAVVESIEAKYDRTGQLDRLKIVAREVG